MDGPVIILQRELSDDHGTFGRLYIDGQPFSFTLEPPWRDNEPTHSCIPKGEYQCVWHKSPRYGWCYLVTGIPNRTLVLHHGGNYGGDRRKKFRTHTWGCILQGRRRGWMDRQRAVLTSKSTVRRFFQRMQRKPFRLRIEGVAG